MVWQEEEQRHLIRVGFFQRDRLPANREIRRFVHSYPASQAPSAKIHWMNSGFGQVAASFGALLEGNGIGQWLSTN